MKKPAFDVWTGVCLPAMASANLQPRPDNKAGRVCANCHQHKPAHAFYVSHSTGRMESYCRPCAAARMKSYRERRKGCDAES